MRGRAEGEITQLVKRLRRRADPTSDRALFLGRLTSSSNKNKCDSITGSIVTAADRPVSRCPRPKRVDARGR